jgi:A/G-specific adenine glycosylase
MPRTPANALRFKRRLLRWFRDQGRRLPWRSTRNPYHIVVSEFMLQQTQVRRVTEYYPKFLRRFPTVEALAKARPSQVREAWEGLGYYRRAANLHRLARAVVSAHGGAIPDDPERLRELPGVGRYTAGAVATFAFEHREAAVDTNVARVLTRVFKPRPTNIRTIWSLATRLLPSRRQTAWEFNQALMDLGALVCVARRPKCGECPVQPACKTGRKKI